MQKINFLNFFNFLITSEDLRNDCFKCGNQELPYQLSVFGHNAFTFVQIIVPSILILLGVIDMAKAVASQKEDEMKKAQNTLVRRTIAAVVFFFVIMSVQFVFGILGDAGFEGEFVDCLDTFINGGATKIECTNTY